MLERILTSQQEVVLAEERRALRDLQAALSRYEATREDQATLELATPLGGGHFPLSPFFILVWLVVGVALARRLFKGRNIFTGRELLVTRPLSERSRD